MVHTFGKPGVPRQKCHLPSQSPIMSTKWLCEVLCAQELVVNPTLINVSGYYYNHMDGQDLDLCSTVT